MPKLDYYFSMVSPWAYIGHEAFMDVVKRNNVEVRYHPVKLLELFEKTGGTPLPKRHISRKNYRMFEMQRWREKRGLEFDLNPPHWPYNFGMADRIVIAIQDSGSDPSGFMGAGYNASWIEGRDMADEGVLTDVLSATGHDAAAIIPSAKSDAIGTIYETDTETCGGDGVFGSPAYILNDEIFWGQDRLEMLNDALASGRAPYSANPSA
ncbi:MAG: 2-hydroxychromene-2-carboxylate isomerase [Rhizobiales bacterium]|nr:2-hydroxychromene-2-carboxylate isomerase [Hyphomicrobiales bacterium]